jgi:type IV pilus assembly protein PilC
MEFNCRYSRPNGKVETAVYSGQNEHEVRHKLDEQGLLPLSIDPVRSLFAPVRSKKRLGFKPDDFVLFNQQFVALIRAGLPIIRSLEILQSRIANEALRSHIERVRESVLSGTALSDALEQEGVFPRVYTASIFAGERSGNLVDVINRYVQYQKTLLSASRKFRNSLIYPAILIVLSMGMVAVILAYVIPRFAELYESLSTALPLPTQILIAVSSTIQGGFVPFLVALAALAVVYQLWKRSAGGRTWIDDLKLRLPVMGHIWLMFAIAQLSRTLATLLQGGIPLVSALEVAREASGNRVIGEAIATGTARVREGMSLADALEKTGKFPELALEMIGVGEQTGALPEMLNHVADFYDEDLDVRLSALLSLVEPLILIFVAVFVALVLISLYLPIFSIGARGAI